MDKTKSVSKAKIRKLEKQLPKIEESVVEEIIPEQEDTSDDPQELRLGDESEKTDFEVEANSEYRNSNQSFSGTRTDHGGRNQLGQWCT